MHKDSASRAQNQALLELCRGAAYLNRIPVFGKDSASRAQNQALLELCRGAAYLNRIPVFGKDSASRAQNQALLELCRGAACLNRISVFGKDGTEPGPFRFLPGPCPPVPGHLSCKDNENQETGFIRIYRDAFYPLQNWFRRFKIKFRATSFGIYLANSRGEY